jgi:hypothetical protein
LRTDEGEAVTPDTLPFSDVGVLAEKLASHFTSALKRPVDTTEAVHLCVREVARRHGILPKQARVSTKKLVEMYEAILNQCGYRPSLLALLGGESLEAEKGRWKDEWQKLTPPFIAAFERKTEKQLQRLPRHVREGMKKLCQQAKDSPERPTHRHFAIADK